ncbi:hypothetical protein GQ457_02G043390 [Hibiscus cannabinus]
MMNSQELEFFEKRRDREFKDVYASDESPAQRSFVGLRPLVIKVGPKSTNDITATTSGLVIKTHVPFPSKHNKQVP